MNGATVHGFLNMEDKELFTLLIGETGGKTRMRILDAILLMPKNANQLAKQLKLDYKTITYHLDIICTHKFATTETFGKITFYYPSDKLIKRLDEYNEIRNKLMLLGS